MEILSALLVSFLLTVPVEGLAIWAKFRRKDFLYYSILCNLLTNPAMNLLLALILHFTGFRFYAPLLLILEAFVILIEADVYRMLCVLCAKHSLLLSFTLNLLSWSAGTVFQALV